MENMFCLKQNSIRIRMAALLLAGLLLISLFPISLSAEESSVRVEPVSVASDDSVSCTVGFLIYCEKPDTGAISLRSAVFPRESGNIVSISDGGLLSGEAAGWLNVTVLGSDSSLSPSFLAEFRNPDNGSELPSFLEIVTVNGVEVLSFSPSYAAYFSVLRTDDEGTVLSETEIASFRAQEAGHMLFLDRPQSLLTKLNQSVEKSEDAYRADGDSSITCYFYYPDTIRSILNNISWNPQAYEQYGFTVPGEIYLQLDVTVNGSESRYNLYSEEEDSAHLWDAPLYPLSYGKNQIVERVSVSFGESSFRATLPDGSLLEIPYGDLEQSEEDSGLYYYGADPEETKFAVRARFVLPVRDSSGAVRYMVSSFSESSFCGAEVNDPEGATSILPPKLISDRMEINPDGSATVYFGVEPSESVRSIAVWMAYYDQGEISMEVESRVNGSEWKPTEFAAEDASITAITGGDYTVTIPAEEVPQYVLINLRARYLATAGGSALSSDFSTSLSFNIEPQEIETTAPPATEAEVTTEEEEEEHPFVCPLCGICPAPFGICLFLWIAAALLLVLIVVLIVAMIPKHRYCPRCGAIRKKGEAVCPECGYRFSAERKPSEEGEQESAANPEKTPDEKGTSSEETREFSTDAATGEEGSSSHQDVPETESVPRPQTEEKPKITLPEVSPLFLAEIRAKLREKKAGGNPSFTREEILYLKALKEKVSENRVPAVEQVSSGSAADSETPSVTDLAAAAAARASKDSGDAERQVREEAERLAEEKEKAERQASEEAERLAREKEEAERQAREEAERLAREKEEAERQAREEAERLAREKEEAERQAREEAERLAREKEEAERQAREEAERLAREK
ncbi:MAG: hypothetical protein J5494_05095, partial [Candidatus Methanomethylophilaceae archaeon]|nr:hypothetical protein [Candidatus Methanomethylophilaceae archaeon]